MANGIAIREAFVPQEIWDKILELLSPESRGLANSEVRSRLSVETFAPGLQLDEGSLGLTDLLSFRQCSRRFDDVSRKHIFNRLEIRFTSHKAVLRLNSFAEADAIAPHVKELSYMMPRLFAYPEGLVEADFASIRDTCRRESAELQAQINNLLSNATSSKISHVAGRQRAPIPPLEKKLLASQVMEKHIDTITQKAIAHSRIIKEELDIQSLLCGLGRFMNLQQIRLMPLVDQADFAFEQYLDNHPDFGLHLRPSLSDGFYHGAKILASTVLESGNRAHKFSSRSIDLGRSFTMTNHLRITLSDMAERLTSMDLQFVYKDSNIKEQRETLLDLFSVVLRAAIRIRSLHIGFGRRVTMPLESVFCNVHFRHLHHLGIHEWRLHAGELISILHQHKDSLRTLRLRQVSLIEEIPKEDGLWKTILCFIRLNLKLEWFSLRGIRYNDDLPAIGSIPFGNTIYGPPPAGDSDSPEDDDNIHDIYSRSSSDSSETEDGAGHQTSTEDPDEETHSPPPSTHGSEADDDDPSDSSDSDSTTVAVPPDDDQDEFSSDNHEEHEDLMSDLDDTHNPTHANDTNNTTIARIKPTGASCYCDSGFAFENFGSDNGNYVTKPQWKKWELWAGKRRCQIGHDPSPSSTQD